MTFFGELAWLGVLTNLLLGSVAGQQMTFTWGFSVVDINDPHSILAECSSLAVEVNSTQLPGVAPPRPPYYMIAYPPSGIPTISRLSPNSSGLRWTVAYSAGTSLLIGVTDSLGNTGGVDTPVYTVGAGTSTTCHSEQRTTPVTITTNVTHLSTCDPWVLDVDGGTPPYVVTIAVQNSVAFNASLGFGNNRYTWFNRAVPTDSNVLLATASDANGNYASATSFITLSGTNDITCGGQTSFASQRPGTSSVPATPSSTSAAVTSNTPSKHTDTIIIAAAASAVVLAIIAAIIVFLWVRRRKRSEHRTSSPLGAYHDPVVYPEPFVSHPDKMAQRQYQASVPYTPSSTSAALSLPPGAAAYPAVHQHPYGVQQSEWHGNVVGAYPYTRTSSGSHHTTHFPHSMTFFPTPETTDIVSSSGASTSGERQEQQHAPRPGLKTPRSSSPTRRPHSATESVPRPLTPPVHADTPIGSPTSVINDVPPAYTKK